MSTVQSWNDDSPVSGIRTTFFPRLSVHRTRCQFVLREKNEQTPNAISSSIDTRFNDSLDRTGDLAGHRPVEGVETASILGGKPSDVDTGAPLEPRSLERNHFLASLSCKVTSMISTKQVLLVGYAAVGSLVLATLAADAPQDGRIRPKYTEKGLLEVPKRFRSWVFVGADLSPRYRSEAGETPRDKNATGQVKPDDSFHTVYINPESYDAFLKTGQFPDPTILVMEVFKAEERDRGGVLAAGQFQGKRIELAAAVKDRNRPGGGVPWAYYSFDLDKDSNPGKPSKAFQDANCYDCHLKHASKDNVWVQFYPALRDPE
jgi:hypothetical protein